jgi:predicted nucleotidyltransferase
VFGSALRRDFRPDSDLDLLVRFATDADWSLLDHVAMEEELAGIVARKVDLVSERAIERSSKLEPPQGHPRDGGAVLCLAMTRIFSTS